MTHLGFVWDNPPMRISPLVLLGLVASSALAAEPSVRFDRITIDDNFPDAYQVEVVDVDGDKKPDIVALGGATIAWYQNPTWTKRVIATGGIPLKADIISSATADLDGDGMAEIAIACDFAMPTPTRGQLFLASQGTTLDAPWTLHKIADVPSIHRVRWADLEGDKKPELIVAPIFGPKSRPPTYDQDMARVVEFRPDVDRPKTGEWVEREIMRRPVVHAVGVFPSKVLGTFPLNVDKITGRWGRNPGSVITADNTGLSQASGVLDKNRRITSWSDGETEFIPGASGPRPKRGCSDFHLVRTATGNGMIATIEPWHGSELVVWNLRDQNSIKAMFRLVMSDNPAALYSRTVIDNALDDGHALWTADVDGDGADEIFAGHRGKDHRVAMYRFDDKTWTRTILDTGVAAQDLRGGDLDGDGVPDVVAVGGKTHNVVWYHPVRLKPGGEGAVR